MAKADDDSEKRRKDRVLHTRVPEVLEVELRRLADGLRMPVSNVVRAILEDAVETMDHVGRKAGDELRDVADILSRRRRRDRGAAPPPPRDEAPAPAPLEAVIGYQPLLLARDERCTLCGAVLERGGQAYLGIRDGAGPRVVIGEECLPIRAPRGGESRARFGAPAKTDSAAARAAGDEEQDHDDQHDR